MDLLTYLKTMEVEEREAFASRCGTTIGHLNNIAYGCKPCSAELAIEIDRESGGKVPCERTNPKADWAHIRGSAVAHGRV